MFAERHLQTSSLSCRYGVRVARSLGHLINPFHTQSGVPFSSLSVRAIISADLLRRWNDVLPQLPLSPGQPRLRRRTRSCCPTQSCRIPWLPVKWLVVPDLASCGQFQIHGCASFLNLKFGGGFLAFRPTPGLCTGAFLAVNLKEYQLKKREL